MIRERLKKFAIKHNNLLSLYRATFGKIKTVLFFGFQSKELQKNGFSMIEIINNELTKEKANFFIDCGTLLGIIRDKKLIEYDRDMDFGIWFDEKFGPDDLDRVMLGLGFKKFSEGIFRGKKEEMTYSKGVIHVDFFNHTEIDGESHLYVFYRDIEKTYPSDKHCSVIMQRRIHISGLKTLNINHMSLKIPENVEPYLASAYTENWRTPDPGWLYTMEPGCTFIEDEYGLKEMY